MHKTILFALLGLLVCGASAQNLERKPADPYFAAFEPKLAPKPSGLVLKKGDRLAICGDSITEQKMYSRMMETYLTVCAPELEVTARQYGWGGETANGFLRRMTNDCLRFEPTIATTCYGMNDHGYRPYTNSIGDRYRTYQTAIVQSFKAAGARVILGSPGCVGLNNSWDAPSVESKNLNLCTLRNIDIEIAQAEGVGFADLFWPMLQAGVQGRAKYGTNYAIAGKDGVHPGWAGSAMMAYAFLKAFGLDGEIGIFTVDLKSGKATVSKGHELVSAQDGVIEISSRRYPFCAPDTNVASDGNIRSMMALTSFNQELNRLRLVAKGGSAGSYKVTWGDSSKTYSATQLAAGVNLAEDFPKNPFVAAFAKVDSAVAAKQSYETKQVKQIFHDLMSGSYKTVEDVKDAEMKELFTLRAPDGKLDRGAIVEATENKRRPLAKAIQTAFVPVRHTIHIVAE